jgi:hypothetical protein
MGSRLARSSARSGAGQNPRIASQLPRTAGGLGGAGSDVPFDRGDQLLFVVAKPAAV